MANLEDESENDEICQHLFAESEEYEFKGFGLEDIYENIHFTLELDQSLKDK